MFGTAIVTAEMLVPITTAITDNVTAVLPVGLGLLALMLGVAVIPRIIYKFF